MPQLLNTATSGAVIWLTGLSGAGKSTLANALAQALQSRNYPCYILDGDRLRQGLNANLGFSPADRTENIRRVGEVAALFADAGTIAIVAVISPYAADRDQARAAAERMGRTFHEVHVATDLATCEARDPKGLYRKARAGQLQGFTGIDAPYEVPATPQLRVPTGELSIEASVSLLVDYVERHCALL